MRIVLIEIEGHGPAFIDEPPLREEEALAARRHGRLRRWLHGKKSKLLDDLDRSRGFSAAWTTRSCSAQFAIWAATTL